MMRPHEKSRMRIMCIVGARPNMVKIAPLIAELRRHDEIEAVLVHTGQHYDYLMSQVFFEQFNMPQPDYNLEVGSGPHYTQTAEIMRRFGDLVQHDRPDMVVVSGDVNSTVACALVAAKEGIPVAHVEAGLRSFDRSMPEEINRILTDTLADFLFTTEESGNQNLANEGIAPEKVFFVGNLMIDTLVKALGGSRESLLRAELGLNAAPYAVLTLHRPSNVDNVEQLTRTLDAIALFAQRIPVVFPAHPRTAQQILGAKHAGLRAVRRWEGGPLHGPGLWMMPPASYLDFLGLIQHAVLVMTDSGGVQEETSFLGVPCLTYRDTTERPVTISMGTNQVVGCDPGQLLDKALEILELGPALEEFPLPRPPLWDGQTAARIVRILKESWLPKEMLDTERVPVL
jgi:UDP-N-acetylglucosamine 2-epimerase (non-hydrolysing)